MYFSHKKSSKNPLKMKPERLKNRCPKRINFWNRYFHVLVSILEGFGPPSWSQVGHLGLSGPSPKPPKSSFLRTCVQDAAQEAPKGVPRRAESSILKDFSWILQPFLVIFGCGDSFSQSKLQVQASLEKYICTFWVTPSPEKLTDFKPHV